MGYIFKGPFRYVKKHKVLVEVKQPDIVSGTLEMDGQMYSLEENSFTVRDGRNSGQLYIYHSYGYPDESGNRLGGRWYNTTLRPTDYSLSPEGLFQYAIQSDEATPIELPIVRLQFTPKAVSYFQEVVEEA